MSTFAYEQADRKHRAGHKLSEPEWEALLAGERARVGELEGCEDTVEKLEEEIEKLEAQVSDLDDRIDDLNDQIASGQREMTELRDELAEAQEKGSMYDGLCD